MSLSHKEHVEIVFIVQRLLDRGNDREGRQAAEAWLGKCWPTLEELEHASEEGARPLMLRLSPSQEALLCRVVDRGFDVPPHTPAAEALVVRDLAEWAPFGRLEPTALGVIEASRRKPRRHRSRAA
jgi:hypothetical protein